MKPLRQINKRYRQILIASLISSGSILPFLPALADPLSPTGGQNSAAPGEIQNQATAEYLDSADSSTQLIVSDIVKVTVAEIAGISASPSTSLPVNNNAGGAPTLYPTSTVYFDFIVKNEGNDPTQLFIPGAPSVATVGGANLPATAVGTLTIVSYSTIAPGTNVVTPTPNAPVNTLVPKATGLATDSVAAGGYVTVRVPITIPFGSANGADINVTLGNTTGSLSTPPNVNTPYIQSGNDLYTQDNTDPSTIPGETAGMPFNGDSTGHRQEASASQTAKVVVPNVVISGKVWDDANNSANNTFGTLAIPIQSTGELGADVTPQLYAVLVKTENGVTTVIESTPVTKGSTTGTNGNYSFTVPGYQNGLSIILSTSNPLAGGVVPAGNLPPAWEKTSPLVSDLFNVTDAAGTVPSGAPLSYINKDFGIELLPTAVGATVSGGVNAVGINSYSVPAGVFTSSTDPDPSNTNPTIGVVAYKITGFPANAVSITINGTNYTPTSFAAAVAANGGVQFTLGELNAGAVKVDPIDGATTVDIPFKAIDAATKLSTNTATGSVPFTADAVTISGTVYNDKDKSAMANNVPTFNNIKTGTEIGTDTLFGTNGTRIYATLINTTTGQVIDSQVIPDTGIYSFSGVAAGINVKVVLSTTQGTTTTLPAAVLTNNWVGTSPLESVPFNTGNYGTNQAAGGFAPKDFGVIQKAKLVIVKRITKINGATTNPNDGTLLSGATSDSFNFNAIKNPNVPNPATYAGNWPTGYIVGAVDAGKVKPGDFIEYTIYFMNNQGADAKNVKICDPIRGSQDYVLNSTSINLTSSSTDAGNAVADNGSRLNIFSGNAVPASCNGINTVGGGNPVLTTGAVNGGVAIDITGATAATNQPTGIPGATAAGVPSTTPTTVGSYGMFRFRTQVKP